MEVAYFPDDPRPLRWLSPVLALGNFDGLHRGHQKIIERIRRGASERGATAVVLTFDPHPPRVVRPDKAPPLLMTTAQKLRALDRAGVNGAAVVRFTPALSQWSPEQFVRTVLVDWLRVAEVWVGADFLFGRDRWSSFGPCASKPTPLHESGPSNLWPARHRPPERRGWGREIIGERRRGALGCRQ